MIAEAVEILKKNMSKEDFIKFDEILDNAPHSFQELIRVAAFEMEPSLFNEDSYERKEKA